MVETASSASGCWSSGIDLIQRNHVNLPENTRYVGYKSSVSENESENSVYRFYLGYVHLHAALRGSLG
jgi:hypothetical protein